MVKGAPTYHLHRNSECLLHSKPVHSHVLCTSTCFLTLLPPCTAISGVWSVRPLRASKVSSVRIVRDTASFWRHTYPHLRNGNRSPRKYAGSNR